MASTIFGFQSSAMPQIIGALQKLQDDPERLAHERQQYNSPPQYPSGTTTRSPSPYRTPPPLTEADHRAIRRQERFLSNPWNQFDYQSRRETTRILYQIEMRRVRRKQTLPFDNKLEYVRNARNNVKNRWRQQGIWRSEWEDYGVNSGWKHEEMPELPTNNSPPPNAMFGYSHKLPKKKTLSRATLAKQKATHDLATVASRPYYQFLFQVSTEREWVIDDTLEDLSESEVETRAYENVKNSWIEQKIWNPSWGHFPGYNWMHEYPDDDEPEKPRPDLFEIPEGDNKNSQLDPASERLNQSPPPRKERRRSGRAGVGTQDPPILRRSARIQARKGTSKHTIYDQPATTDPEAKPRKSTRNLPKKKSPKNLQGSANPRKPRGVLKKRPK